MVFTSRVRRAAALTCVVHLSLLVPPHVLGQPASEAEALGRAYALLAAQRPAEALRAAERILAASPRHHGAATLAVLAAAGASADQGLVQYERWLASGRADDAHMLEPVALAVLRELGGSGQGSTDTEARAALAAVEGRTPDGPSTPSGRSPRQLAAELGRPDPPNRLTLLRELAKARDSSVAAQVRPLLADPSPDIRAAAAETLGAIGADAAAADLRQRLQDPATEVRAAAALALRRLGDASGDGLVMDLLTSGIPDIQIQAAEALSEEPASAWAPYIEPLLQSDAPMTRLHAARLLLPVHPERAREAIAGLLDSPNPVVVGEMARTLADHALADVPTIRRLLRHPSPEARLHGAQSLLRVTGAMP